MTDKKENKPKTYRLKVDDGFDPDDVDMMMEFTTRVQEAIAHGSVPDGYAYAKTETKTDPRTGRPQRYAYLMPSEFDMPGKDGKDGYKRIHLTRNQFNRPKFLVSKVESQYDGWWVTRLDDIHADVYLSRLDPETITNRRIFSDALGLDPWDIDVTRIQGKGWKIRLPRTYTYVPSKRDSRLQEAVDQVAGTQGWFFEANPKTGVILVHPAKPSTFPMTVPTPTDVLDKPNLRYTPFGMKLPDRGRRTGDLLTIDWKDAHAVLIAASAGSGKSVVINDLIYGNLLAGVQLYICDQYAKSTDFAWCRPWVTKNGWGCDSLESAAAIVMHLYSMCDKGGERAKAWIEHGWVNWWDIPDEAKKDYPAILLVMDEITQLTVKINTRGLDKDDPMKAKLDYENSIKTQISAYMIKLVQVARAFGFRFIYCSQRASESTGLGPDARVNLPTHLVPGERTPDELKSIFSDKNHLPSVPEYLIEQGVSRGVGLAEISGQNACVYKSFYNPDNENFLHRKLEEHIGVGNDPSYSTVSNDFILHNVPSAMNKPDEAMGGETGDEPRTESRLESEGGFGIDGRTVAEHDAPLRGAARAAHASAIEEAQRIARESRRQQL
jgi:hypothetical protein